MLISFNKIHHQPDTNRYYSINKRLETNPKATSLQHIPLQAEFLKANFVTFSSNNLKDLNPLQQFHLLTARLENIEGIIRLLKLDRKEGNMPKKAEKARDSHIHTMQIRYNNILKSDTFGQLLETLPKTKKLNSKDQAKIDKYRLKRSEYLSKKKSEPELSSIEAFKQHIHQINDLDGILRIVDWAQKTHNIPLESDYFTVRERTSIKVLMNNLKKAPKLRVLLDHLNKPEVYATLSDDDRALVNKWNAENQLASKLSYDLISKKEAQVAKSINVWRNALQENNGHGNFKTFIPNLTEIFKLAKEEARAIDPTKASYDVLLNKYSPGITMQELDSIFARLEPALKNIQQKAMLKEKSEPEFLSRPIDVDKAKQFYKQLMEKMGFDLSRGAIGEAKHPYFQQVASPVDVRIAMGKMPETLTVNKFLRKMFGLMHETGHGMLEQSAREDLQGTGLTGAFIAIHESQSRMWENIIGKSKPFLEYILPELQKAFPEQFADVTVDELYEAVNKVKPSFIRGSADEVTYNLHVLLRYQIEKELVDSTKSDKDIENKVQHLSKTWNNKMIQILGIKPPDDKKGVLQDIHWAIGEVGYFPSYTLGNIASAQMYQAMKNDLARQGINIDDEIRSGNLTIIRNWFKEKFYVDGKIKSPQEILETVTGEKNFNPEYLIAYLEEKYCK